MLASSARASRRLWASRFKRVDFPMPIGPATTKSAGILSIDPMRQLVARGAMETDVMLRLFREIFNHLFCVD
jgi:hypothetical protein